MEKIRFFWPKVALEKSYKGTFKWHNFQSRADVVAGTLKLYRPSRTDKVENHKIRGAGGLITAHNGYRSHPTFLSIFGPRLTGFETAIQPSARWRLLHGLHEFLESAVATVALVGLSIVGASIFFAAGYLGVRLVRRLAAEEIETWSWVTLDGGAIGFGIALTFFAIVLPLFFAKKSAQVVHNRYWLTVTSQDGYANPESAGA